MTIDVRRAAPDDFPSIWEIFHAAVAPGDTYAHDPAITREEVRRLCFDPPALTYVAVEAGRIVGIYVLRPNQPGLGNHVANCSYMTLPAARGRGIASAMCAHSLDAAREHGYTAMQFNYVVASNETAVRLWKKHGFSIVGRVPAAFRHATRGLTDIIIMHRPL